MTMISSRVPLTWLMLTHRKGRLLVAIFGIAFAVLLMFMQLGFLTGLFDSQTLAIRLFDADIVITNKTRHNLHVEESFLSARLRQAQDVPGVASTTSFLMENGLWRNPQTGKLYVIRVLGIDPDRPPFTFDNMIEKATTLKAGERVLFDKGSRDFFGAIQVGMDIELSNKRLTVSALFDLGADFKNDGTAVVSSTTFRQIFPFVRPDQTAVGLVKALPGTPITNLVADLEKALPNDILVLSVADYDKLERSFWSKMTPTGFIFTLGLVVGFVIGVMICYQILYNEINDHLPQFATLKAVGFPESYLVGVVLKEAILLALLGLLPAIIASQLFYSLMIRLSGLHMELTVERVIGVSLLTIIMCVISGLLAVIRVLKTDPAEVF